MPAVDVFPTAMRSPSLDAAAVAKLSTREVMEQAAASARHMASQAGLLLLLVGELDRREGWRSEGATSLETWMVERFGFSVATARAFAHVSARLFDLPQLADGLTAGELSFDKVRAVVDTATPQTDQDLRREAKTHSVVELVQLARAQHPPSSSTAGSERDRRSLRFNDSFRTVTAQLPSETYAEVRGHLETAAKQIPSEGETLWDQRLCDAFVATIRAASAPAAAPGMQSKSAFTVVTHVPIDTLLDDSSELPGELERHGLISAQTVRRVACDATIIVAADDGAGRTMYEGRGRRYPTETQRREILRRDRHCRFPGCMNAIFVNPHHLRWWRAHGGTTDLPNLVLLCEHHHHLVHSKLWTVSGDANDELVFVGPSGRALTSRPSPLWAAVTDGQRRRRHSEGSSGN